MRLLTQGNGLLHHVHATQHQCATKRDQGPECLKRLCNLCSKFSCRGQHKGEQGLGLLEEGLENGEGEGCSFTATSLCKTDDIAVLQRKGDGLGLNGSWVLVSKLLAGVAEGVDNTLVPSVNHIPRKPIDTAYQVLERLWDQRPVSFARRIIEGGRLGVGAGRRWGWFGWLRRGLRF